MPASLVRKPRTVSFLTLKLSRLFLAGLVFLSCGKTQAPAPQPPVVVEVTPVVQKDVPIYGETIATLDGYVNASIRPQVEGYLLRQRYREGFVVRKGDVLFVIDPRQFQAALDQANGDLARAEATLVNARQTVARYTPLAAENAISQQELDNAVAAERQARATVDGARAAAERARLNLNWSSVTSPIDGIAGIAKAQVGDLVTPQSELTTVSSLDPIKAIFSISEQTYMRFAEEIRRGDPGPPLQMVLSDGTKYPHVGRVLFADRQMDVKTGTITLKGEFRNPGNLLRPGQFARIRAATETRKGALLVPQKAVMELQGSSMVVVVTSENKAEMRPIQIGVAVDESVIVEKGLKPGERVVVEGMLKVRPGSVVDPKPAAAAPATPAPASGQ